MNNAPTHLAYCAWLGAVVERLRRGEAPFPFTPEGRMETQAWVLADQGRFGLSPLDGSQSDGTFSERHCPEELSSLYVEIMERARGKAWEAELWGFLLNAPWPPPGSVLDDLLARDMETEQIGHMLLPDARLFALADRVPEALLTLAKRRYVGAQYDEHRFEEVLHAYPTHKWMLSSLPRMEPSCRAKTVVLAKYIRALPDSAEYLKWQSAEFEEVWNARA